MLAEYIFAVLGPLFLILGAAQIIRGGKALTQGRIWMLIGIIFTVVSAWLFYQR